jgi:hypothetical protein
MIGIEIKASASVKTSDFNGLRKLSSASKNFKLGLVLYDGERALPFGDACTPHPSPASVARRRPE